MTLQKSAPQPKKMPSVSFISTSLGINCGVCQEIAKEVEKQTGKLIEEKVTLEENRIEQSILDHILEKHTTAITKLEDKVKSIIEEDLAENAKVLGERFRNGMNTIIDKYDLVTLVRGKGLLTAFEMHDDPKLDGHAVSVGPLNFGCIRKRDSPYYC